MAKKLTCIVNTGNTGIGDKGYIKFHNVNGIEKFVDFITRDYPLWKWATVYDKKTREKLGRIHPEGSSKVSDMIPEE